MFHLLSIHMTAATMGFKKHHKTIFKIKLPLSSTHPYFSSEVKNWRTIGIFGGTKCNMTFFFPVDLLRSEGYCT